MAKALNDNVEEDLRSFLQKNELTFRRLPGSNVTKVNVTTTCTVLMALASNGILSRFYNTARTTRAFKRMVAARWKSSGLKDGNAFTTILVFRTAGFLAKAKALKASDVLKLTKGTKSRKLHDLLRTVTGPNADVPHCFQLDATLRENPALGYWYLDALDKLGLTSGAAVSQIEWTRLAAWSSGEFARQVSLVAAEHDSMKDPIAMVMAACLAQRLRTIANRVSFRYGNDVKALLPSRPELTRGIELFFSLQQPSGIWNKFFPMFYYHEDRSSPTGVDRGGANYCFAFEVLEALLNEFGREMLARPKIVDGLEKAAKWCEENRLVYHFRNDAYHGWNSGQQVDSLSKGEPESWATGVVHMFLQRLSETLSDDIQRILLDKYDATYVIKKGTQSRWDKFIDPTVHLPGGKTSTVSKVIRREITERVDVAFDEDQKHLPLRERDRPRIDILGRRSALLFGPPGTSKTTVVEALAEELELPYLEITPSHFLRHGLEKIYVEANKIFDDLMDLSGAVILFDEMDALVQRRSSEGQTERIDVTRQFLTTSMLPKLAKLHKRKRVIFCMATNHQQDFDEAIKRPGRFDLLLHLAPPPWSEKQKHLKVWLNAQSDDVPQICDRITDWVGNNATIERMLDDFTYGEMQELFDHLSREGSSLLKVIAKAGGEKHFRGSGISMA